MTNAPDGFFITFKDTEAFLEQPQGNVTLQKVAAEKEGETKSSESTKELIGKYESEQNKGSIIEIKEVSGKVSLVVGEQPPYPLVEKDKDIFGSTLLPDSYAIKVNVPKTENFRELCWFSPKANFLLNISAKQKKTLKIKMSVDDLMAKTIEALGGEENWKKLNSRVMKVDIDYVHQGLKGTGNAYAKAPNATASILQR